MAKQHRTEQEWLNIFQKAGQTDLTINQFCCNQQISVSTFYAKKSKLLAQFPGTGFVQAKIVRQSSCMIEEHACAESISIDVDGVKIQLSHQTPAYYIAQLVKGLRA